MASSLSRLTIDELTALNNEIMMLSKSGVPLSEGLTHFARESSGELERVVSRLTERLQSGSTLGESVRGETGEFPDLYASVVEAGVRSGRLASSLEAIANFARQISQLRRDLSRSLIYPLITVIVAYVLFVSFVSHGVSYVVDWSLMTGEQIRPSIKWLHWLLEHKAFWVWIPPAILGILIIAWVRSSRSSAFALRGFDRIIALLPGVGKAASFFRHSLFAQQLALLVERDVPFHDALLLSAAGCGKKLQLASKSFAEADTRGERHQIDRKQTNGMRPLLHWVLRRQQNSARLVSSLNVLAQSYFERGRGTVRWIQFVIPLFCLFIVAGGITAVYSVSLFLPLTDILSNTSDAI